MDSIYEQYQREGCLKIENFLTLEEVEELKKGSSDLENMINDEIEVTQKETNDILSDSADEIKCTESDDSNDQGNLTKEIKQALNDVRCGLHWWHPIFRKHTFSQKMKDLMKTLQYKDPIIIYSMLLIKEPKTGELIPPHQDSTDLYSEPPTCIGVGFPLEDITLENGCLWYVPGTNKGNHVYKRYVQNEDEDPKLVKEGKLPEFSDEEFVPVPAKKGDCILLHGSTIHKSLHNMTENATAMYLYIMVEKDAKWSPLNCFQPTEKLPFLSLYSN